MVLLGLVNHHVELAVLACAGVPEHYYSASRCCRLHRTALKSMSLLQHGDIREKTTLSCERATQSTWLSRPYITSALHVLHDMCTIPQLALALQGSPSMTVPRMTMSPPCPPCSKTPGV